MRGFSGAAAAHPGTCPPGWRPVCSPRREWRNSYIGEGQKDGVVVDSPSGKLAPGLVPVRFELDTDRGEPIPYLVSQLEAARGEITVRMAENRVPAKMMNPAMKATMRTDQPLS